MKDQGIKGPMTLSDLTEILSVFQAMKKVIAADMKNLPNRTTSTANKLYYPLVKKYSKKSIICFVSKSSILSDIVIIFIVRYFNLSLGYL